MTIGSDCRLTDCVVTDGVQLPDGSTLDRQAVVLMPKDTAQAMDIPGAKRIGDLLIVPIEHAPSA